MSRESQYEHQLVVRVDTKTFDAIHRMADRNFRTAAQEIRLAIAKHLGWVDNA